MKLFEFDPRLGLTRLRYIDLSHVLTFSPLLTDIGHLRFEMLLAFRDKPVVVEHWDHEVSNRLIETDPSLSIQEHQERIAQHRMMFASEYERLAKEWRQ